MSQTISYFCILVVQLIQHLTVKGYAMKRILFLLSVVGIYGVVAQANGPTAVTVDEEFNVTEVMERIDNHMANLETWYATARRCAKKNTKGRKFDMGPLREAVEVTHPAMVECLAKMEQQESLEPLFALWQQFKNEHSDSQQDKLLCKECALLDMHLYSTMLSHLQRSGTRVGVAEMLELYHIIAALPIYELLSLLDSIAREIITLLDQAYHGETSFFSWLWNNWWVPPTIVSNAVTSLVEGLAEILDQNEAVQEQEEAPESQETVQETSEESVVA